MASRLKKFFKKSLKSFEKMLDKRKQFVVLYTSCRREGTSEQDFGLANAD